MKISGVLLRVAVWSCALMVTGCSQTPRQHGSTDMHIRTVAISTIVEVPPLLDAKEGVIKALAERGFVQGKNLTIKYQNANGNKAAQQEIAKKFVDDGADVIVALSTTTAQAMLDATKEIPIVFAAVTDPVKAKLIEDFGKPGPNITGVSDAAPLEPQMNLFKELLPNLKQIGYIYNPHVPSPVSTLASLRRIADQMGIKVVESQASSAEEVIPATTKLIGHVDAIYVPNDTTINPVLESIIKIGRDNKTPVFTGEADSVERGAVGSVGINYFDIGRLAGNMVADVLSGKKVSDIESILAYKRLTEFKLVINKGAAAAMGVTVPESVIKRASKVID